ncbi:MULTISPECIES: NUDIX hydrolase [unclassified Streptomyces]|uniref:NUDIX hydrolase n=1 Tax=unclassified Streptomyces TaxID=2593676 RepID=UPI001448A24F|nr:NUDIX hydrolase [Streptomyces sp. A1136]
MPDRPSTDRPPPDRPPPPRPSAGGAGADHAARRAPLLTATGIVLDPHGRVLVLATARGDAFELPDAAVTDTETPEAALGRWLRDELGLEATVGRLLAVDSHRPGALGRSLVTHVHLVGPLAGARAASIAHGGAGITGAHWLTPEQAHELLPAHASRRLRAALAALHAGSFAHLADGSPQPGSPAGLDPARRAELEHAGAFDAAAHRASRPKAVTAASVVFTDPAGRVLLVRPAYGKPGRWILPGGGVESDLGETPRTAAAREVREETGLDRAPGRLLAINWAHKRGRPARIRFLYDGGVLDPAELADIRLPRGELLGWRTADRGELRGLVKPLLRRQIEACLTALAQGTGPLELHAGRPCGEPGPEEPRRGELRMRNP